MTLCITDKLCPPFVSGTPNKPILGTISFQKDSITLAWRVERDDLRPIDGYNITIEAIRVKGPPGVADATKRVNRQISLDKRIETRQLRVTKVNCKPDPASGMGMDYCEHTVEEDVKPDTAYNVILCAGNEFDVVCDESEFALPSITAPTTIARKL